MSTAEVRTAFRDRWPDYAPGIVLLDAINEAVPPDQLQAAVDGLAGTIAFNMDGRRDTTLGRMPWVEETGTALVRIYGPSGAGDGPVAQAATDVARRLAGMLLTPSTLVQDATGPVEEDMAADGVAYWLTIACRYVHQTREPRVQ